MQNKLTKKKIEQLYEMPFLSLLFQAQSVHRQHFNPDELELCTLLSIKTGTCPENCGYCSQSAHYKTGLKKEKLIALDTVIEKAKQAKQNGASRFCMGAAWRNPSKKDFPLVLDMIKAVKEIGLETCVTLGMLTQEQTLALKEAGLDFYNHNLDTSPEYYSQIVSTRTYQDRLDTLKEVRDCGIKVCCGAILGMGETREDWISLLWQLASLPTPPESVPINQLIPIPGTPLANASGITTTDFVRTIAIARIIMPSSIIRLSAGRFKMSEETQILCFLAGANSIWLGEKLLTVANTPDDKDLVMLKKLGITTHTQLQKTSNVRNAIN